MLVQGKAVLVVVGYLLKTLDSGFQVLGLFFQRFNHVLALVEANFFLLQFISKQGVVRLQPLQRSPQRLSLLQLLL